MKMPDYLLWVDLETTGLDPRSEIPLEIAVILTDIKLESFLWMSFSISRSDEQIKELERRVSIEVWQMHEDNGLWSDCVKSDKTVPFLDALISGLVADCVEDDAVIWLAGNSPHFDRGFLDKDFPRVAGLLDRHNLDMTGVQAFLGLAGFEVSRGDRPHRAWDDINGCLNEAREALSTLEGALQIVLSSSLAKVSDETVVDLVRADNARSVD